MMNKAYLLLGSNLKQPEKQLSIAIEHLSTPGKIICKSSLYKTAAWGKKDQPDFLNQVVILKTKLAAFDLLNANLEIEMKMGRIREEKNAPRIIDIDILFYNDEIINEPGLTVPHPEIANRRFVLVPLTELSPRKKHPLLNLTISRMLKDCPDSLNVERI